MKSIKCLIADDEPLARSLIASHIALCPQLECVATCKNIQEVMAYTAKHTVDLMFLDIEMPGINGIEFLKSWAENHDVIFITAHRSYAVEAFEVSAVDYLLKPVSLERFLKAVKKFISKKEENDLTKDYIFIPYERAMQKISIDKLMYVEAMGDYCKFYMATQEKRIISKISLQKSIELLDAASFIQIHRSFIINPFFIQAFTAEKVKINEKWLVIGRAFKQAFAEKML